MNPKGRKKRKTMKSSAYENTKRASLLDFSESEQRSPRLFLRRLSITKVWIYEVL
jgi:hypothetical protein